MINKIKAFIYFKLELISLFSFDNLNYLKLMSLVRIELNPLLT